MSSAPAPRSRSCPRAEGGLSAPRRPPRGSALALLCLLLLLAACSPATGSSPGIKGRVTQRALEYGGCLGWEGEIGGLVGHPRTMSRSREWPEPSSTLGCSGTSPEPPCSAPGRHFGLELLRSQLQKEHELNLQGSYRPPFLGEIQYSVPR